MLQAHELMDRAEALFEYTRDLRRDFHQHPEIGFQEYRTAGIVASELHELGLEVSTGIAETGVVAMMEGDQPGPTLLLRFDMDALPIQEETGAPYASQNDGLMHACGHDGHTAIGLTVAKMLNEQRQALSGRIKFVFQPAEEGLGGAERMVAEGVLSNPRPDVSMALHIWNEKPLGWIGVTNGPAMAGAELFSIKLTGQGTHAAMPHNGRDPIVASAQIITALQSISSRNVSPLDSTVVSVTRVRSGDAFNIIPQTATLDGTIRTFTKEARDETLKRFQAIVDGIARAMGCEADITLQGITPAVVNNLDIAAKVRGSIDAVLEPGQLDTEHRTMAAEDFSFMMNDIPGCFLFIGCSNAGEGLDAPHHNPRFDFDERVLPRAAGLLATAAADFLR
jgi:amidohydrolase